MDRKKVAAELEKKVKAPCHRCGNSAFSLIDGYSNFPIQSELNGNIVLGGPSVPVALIVCNNCGAITPHALGALGLLPKSDSVKGEGNG